MKGAKDFLKVVGACLVLIALFQLGLFVLGFYLNYALRGAPGCT